MQQTIISHTLGLICLQKQGMDITLLQYFWATPGIMALLHVLNEEGFSFPGIAFKHPEQLFSAGNTPGTYYSQSR